MLRKLIFSVLVLSLMLAFTSTAFADTRKPENASADQRSTVVVKSDRMTETFDSRAHTAGQTAKTATLTEMGVDFPYPSPYAPDHECEVLDIADYTGTYYGVDLYSDLDGVQLSNRFEVQQFHNAVVYGAAVRVYGMSANAGDVTFHVYEDAGGVPGLELYSEIIPAATMLANGAGHWIFPFSSSVAISGGAYHISYEAGNWVDPDPVAGDYITFGINQNGDGGDHGQSNFYDPGDIAWYPLRDLFGGFPLNLRLSSDVCYVFNDCYSTAIPDASWFGPGYAMPVNWGDGTYWAGNSQRHEAINDTLISVTMGHLDAPIAPDPQWYAGTNETNGMIFEVWADLAGAPDMAAGPLASVTIPGGLANMFPSGGGGLGTWATEYITADFSSFNLIFKGAFHASWRMSSSDIADGGVVPLIEASAGGGGYIDMDIALDPNTNTPDAAFWGGSSHSMTINVEMCRDEYQECQTQKLYTGADWGTGFSLAWDANGDGTFDPSGNGDDGNYHDVAQKVKGRTANRVEGASFMVANNNWYGGDPIGDMAVKLKVYNETTDIYGDLTPGTVLWESAEIPVNDASPWNAWGELWVDVVIPDVLTSGDFWIGYEGINLGGERIRGVNDGDWGPANVNGGGWLFYNPWGEWISVGLFGIGVNNWWITVDFCSIPEPEWPCGIADWGTLQGNYMRQGHASVGVGNAQCDLDLVWSYVHPTGKFGQYTGPVIYNNTLVATFRGANTEYKTFDLITKVEGYTLTMDGNVTGMPTIQYIDALGIDVMFVSGGTADQIVAAYDFATGLPIYTISTTGLGVALGMGAGETNPYANFIISNLDDGGGAMDVLFFSTDVGRVYAIDATNGAPYWVAPFIPTGFGSVSNRTGTADVTGENLFYGYAAVIGGDVISLSAYDGSINWQLSDDGLKGNDAYGGGVTIEQFQAGMAYDHMDNYLYAVSTCAGDHPRAGCLYQINAGTGLIANDVQPVNGVNNTMTPVIDVQNVIIPTRAIWFRGPNDPFSVQAYRKSDLTFSWGVGYGGNASADFGTSEILMTCEVEENDYVFMFSRNGVLHCIDGNAGVEVFERKITESTYGGAAGALALDADGFSHLVFQDASGGLYDFMASGVARARLQLLRGNGAENAARGEVPFGTDLAYIVTFTDVMKNTGCEDLNVTLTLTETSNGGPDVPYSRGVSTSFGQDALNLAAGMTDAKFTLENTRVETRDYDANLVNTFSKEVSSNPAALALGFVNTDVIVMVVAADGENVDVDVSVDQAAVGRGVFPWYATFDSDDPDFWLDDANVGGAPLPEAMFTFLGGCIMEFTALPFGVDQLNEQIVFNSGRVVENGIGDFTIDGVAGVNFQAYYLFGVSDHEMSFTIVSWLEGSGETSTWNGWLPELYNNQCVPVLTEAVAMGNYSETGTDGYVSVITGNTVAYNSIDSVQDFTDTNEADGWNHANFIAPFSNTLTMGLTIEHLVLGAYDFGFDAGFPGDGILDDIGNATIELFNFTERNGNPVTGWNFSAYYDWDIGSRDTTNVHQDASLAYTYDAGDAGSMVGGSVKLPFNFCSDVADPNYLAPIKRGITLGQDQAMWGSLGSSGNDVWYLDSAYFYMTMPDSALSTEYVQIDYSAEDQAGSYVIASHDFAGGDSYKMGVVNFQFQDYGGNNKNTARMKALAHTMNKWMGFGRGDVNNDNVIDMMDIIYTSNYVGGGAGPIPFEYLGDVNVDGATNGLDVTAIADYYFGSGGCFGGEWTM